MAKARALRGVRKRSLTENLGRPAVFPQEPLQEYCEDYRQSAVEYAEFAQKTEHRNLDGWEKINSLLY